MHPERITREDQKLVNSLNYDGIEFLVREKGISKIEKKNNICINVFCYASKLTFPIYVSDQKLENSMDLLLVIDENKSHYVYIKDFNIFIRVGFRGWCGGRASSFFLQSLVFLVFFCNHFEELQTV